MVSMHLSIYIVQTATQTCLYVSDKVAGFRPFPHYDRCDEEDQPLLLGMSAHFVQQEKRLMDQIDEDREKRRKEVKTCLRELWTVFVSRVEPQMTSLYKPPGF